MLELAFACAGVDCDRFAVAPTLVFDVRITEHTGVPVHAMALQCQIRIEPHRRVYDDDEARRLVDVFGERSQWADSMHPFQFATVTHLVPGFRDHTQVAISVPCTYDMEVTCGKYFASLDGGDVPFVLLFSGSVFLSGGHGFTVERVPWHHECSHLMPVSVWRDMMALHFGDSGWLRLRRESIDAIRAYAAREAIPTWDQAVERLLKEAGWVPR